MCVYLIIWSDSYIALLTYFSDRSYIRLTSPRSQFFPLPILVPASFYKFVHFPQLGRLSWPANPQSWLLWLKRLDNSFKQVCTCFTILGLVVVFSLFEVNSWYKELIEKSSQNVFSIIFGQNFQYLFFVVKKMKASPSLYFVTADVPKKITLLTAF